jgi:hypothetical protein
MAHTMERSTTVTIAGERIIEYNSFCVRTHPMIIKFEVSNIITFHQNVQKWNTIISFHLTGKFDRIMN